MIDKRQFGNALFCLRRRGKFIGSGWSENMSATLHTLSAKKGDTVEICATERFTSVSMSALLALPARKRGITGLEITFRGEVTLLSPIHMIATNLSFSRALEKFLHQQGSDFADFDKNDGRLRMISGRQFLLTIGANGKPVVVTEMFRGGCIVPPDSGTIAECAGDIADESGAWMLRNLATDGGLPYKYWPSRGEESHADNAIRRFLASLALARLAKLRGSTEFCVAAKRNLQYNLRRYFSDWGDGRAVIAENNEAKLGAAAIAGIAIMENPASAEFERELTMLATAINSMVDKDTGFRTFFFPDSRCGQNWNFYSGEALLFWAESVKRQKHWAPSLSLCAKTAERCRDIHRRSRNPAFVPWHTQALVSLFEQTKERMFSDFVFEMNDWLLPMQQWEGVADDLRGRFYDPLHPEYGPPHASSTGVYLEGFADALRLAQIVGHSGRACAYERVIRRGLRSLRQLQFRNDVDTFYVANQKRVLGGLRTEVYDNTVRVDSVAHALCATIKVLQLTD